MSIQGVHSELGYLTAQSNILQIVCGHRLRTCKKIAWENEDGVIVWEPWLEQSNRNSVGKGEEGRNCGRSQNSLLQKQNGILSSQTFLLTHQE